ncbi:MAG: AAA domain-containing protein [Nostoc sp.]
MIVSMVHNNSRENVAFTKKPERVNVAFSCAQELLVLVGCHSLFTQQRGQIGSMYSNVSNIVRLHGGFVNVSCLFC